MDNENTVNTAAQTEQPQAVNKRMKTCKACGAAIAKNAKACPSCGAKNRKPIYKRVWFWFLCLIAVLCLANVIMNLISPPSRATITDKLGNTMSLSVKDLEKIHNENASAFSERFGLADAEITTKVLRVGNIYYETIDNKRFTYVTIFLSGGWELHLLEEPNRELVNGLKNGDTLHIQSKITRLSGEYVFRDFLIKGDAIYDRSIVTVVR